MLLLLFMLSMLLQGGRPGLDDVSGLDATLHTNLLSVKACPAEQVEHLGLTFAAEQQLLGRVRAARERRTGTSSFVGHLVAADC